MSGDERFNRATTDARFRIAQRKGKSRAAKEAEEAAADPRFAPDQMFDPTVKSKARTDRYGRKLAPAASASESESESDDGAAAAFVPRRRKGKKKASQVDIRGTGKGALASDSETDVRPRGRATARRR